MAGFEEIMRLQPWLKPGHKPQLDTQDRERDNPHRAGPENLPPAHRGLRPGGSNLCGNLVELRWL